LYSTFVIALAFLFALGILSVASGSMNGSMDDGLFNNTLPKEDANNEDYGQDRKTQSCEMPPCPPGEMCIQVCPESVPQ
jgi:hypothetical protein